MIPATTKYTVLLLDPDVPSPDLPLDRILLGNFVHLIVSDVQPDCTLFLILDNPRFLHPSQQIVHPRMSP